MASSFPIPQTSLQPGSRTFGPATIPDADSQVTLAVDRTVAGGLNSLTAASTLSMTAEMSSDGGVTWHAVDTGAAGTQTAWSAEGGTFTNSHTGLPITVSSGTWPLFPGAGRRLRATVTVAGPSAITVAGSIATQ
jgi:hypothetical protein